MNAPVPMSAINAAPAATDAPPITLTRFCNPDGRAVGKTYSLVNGVPVKKIAGTNVARGDVLTVHNAADLAEVINKLTGAEFLCAGVPVSGLQSFEVGTADYPKPNGVTRGDADFCLPSGPGIGLIDSDVGPATPPHLCFDFTQIRDALTKATGFEFSTLGRVLYPSSSSFIETRDGNPGVLKGHHTMFLLRDASDWPRALEVIFRRLVIAGYGFPFISGSGVQYVRSVIDASVAHGFGRPIFSGPALLGPGLSYSKERRVRFANGPLFDTRAVIKELSVEECAEFEQVKAAILNESAEEASEVRRVYNESRAANMVTRGATKEQAAIACSRAALGHLEPQWQIYLADGAVVSVADILADPTRFRGVACYDPIEPDYSENRVTAKIYCEGVSKICSFAHGGNGAGGPSTYLLSAGISAAEFDVMPSTETSTLPLPEFKRSDKGMVFADKSNVVLALTRPDICGVQIKHDSFRSETMVSPPGTKDWRSFRDVDYTAICLHLERFGFVDISTERIRNAVAFVADRNQFDSAKTWLSALEWDGVFRVDTFLPKYFGTDDTPYTRAVSRYLWTALAGRVMEPGIKVDMVPVAVGAQGARKSSAVAAIAPAADFFLELDLGSQDDDLARLMRGKLVIELGELKGLRAREMEHVKSFLTRRHEEWVPKYNEMQVRYARRCVIIGTTNKDEFLQDDTGHRRWLPFRTRECDPQGIADDRDQLWAEALLMFSAGGVMWRDAESLAKLEHEAYVVRDPWEEPVEAWLLAPASCDLADDTALLRMHVPFTAVTVLREAVGLEARALNHSAKERMAAVLMSLGHRHGFKRDRAYIDGKRERAYVMSA